MLWPQRKTLSPSGKLVARQLGLVDRLPEVERRAVVRRLDAAHRLGADTVQGDDQKRTLTPAEAIRRGADYLVIGRPIRMAEDPIFAAEQIIGEISAGLRMRGR